MCAGIVNTKIHGITSINLYVRQAITMALDRLSAVLNVSFMLFLYFVVYCLVQRLETVILL